MIDKVSGRTAQAGDVVAGGIALATLIVADQVTALHPLFGLPLFLYLIRDFKRPSSLSDRLIVSMSISFATLLFTCYPIDLILGHYAMADKWDIVLLIQWIPAFLFCWAVRTEYELRTPRGEI